MKRALSLSAAIAALAAAPGCRTPEGSVAPQPASSAVPQAAPPPAAPTPPASRCVDLEALGDLAACACGSEAACMSECDQGSVKDCAALGGCEGTKVFGGPDPAKYLLYSKRACDLGDPLGCTNLGDAYLKGAGGTPDRALADAAFARAFAGHRAACEGGDGGACYMLGHAYDHGQGVAKDAAKALELYRKGCAQGAVFPCMMLAVRAGEAGRPEEAVGHVARLCELICACDPLLDARKRGSPAAARALAAWKDRCAKGDTVACETAARVEKTRAGLTARVRFTGNRALTSEELGAGLAIDKPDRVPQAGASREEVIERDALVLAAFYYDHGYLMIRVDPAEVAPSADGTFLDVHFHVDEGPRFHIGKIAIAERDENGKVVAPLGGKPLRARVSSKDGAWFSRAELIRDLGAISTLYRDAGYADVVAEPETKLDAARAVIDITVPVRRGPLVHVGRIIFEGKGRAAGEAHRADLGIAEGQLFSETWLLEAKRQLEALGIFQRVDVSTNAGPGPGQSRRRSRSSSALEALLPGRVPCTISRAARRPRRAASQRSSARCSST